MPLVLDPAGIQIALQLTGQVVSPCHIPLANTMILNLFVECTKKPHSINWVARVIVSHSFSLTACYKGFFIALIHPIQWTIANPVGADRPAKRQKKTSCVSNDWPVPVLCIRQVAHGIYFLKFTIFAVLPIQLFIKSISSLIICKCVK